MKSDRILGIFALMLGIWIFWTTQDFPGAANHRPGPAFLPNLLAIFIALCGGMLIFSQKRESVKKPESVSNAADESTVCLNEPLASFKQSWIRVLMLAAGSAAYVALLDVLGFIPTAGLLTFFVYLFLGNRWLVSAVATILLIAGTYVLFGQILGVMLPRGIWG